MVSKISSASKQQVKNEADRLIAAKISAETEKGLYVRVSFAFYY